MVPVAKNGVVHTKLGPETPNAAQGARQVFSPPLLAKKNDSYRFAAVVYAALRARFLTATTTINWRSRNS